MPAITLAFAAGLVALGLAAYVATDQASITAMIPAFFGIALGLCGLVAFKESLRKHAMHAAAAIALLGAIGALSRALPGLDLSQSPGAATMAQLAMSAALIVFLALCVRSFIHARRAG